MGRDTFQEQESKHEDTPVGMWQQLGGGWWGSMKSHGRRGRMECRVGGSAGRTWWQTGWTQPASVPGTIHAHPSHVTECSLMASGRGTTTGSQTPLADPAAFLSLPSLQHPWRPHIQGGSVPRWIPEGLSGVKLTSPLFPPHWPVTCKQ